MVSWYMEDFSSCRLQQQSGKPQALFPVGTPSWVYSHLAIPAWLDNSLKGPPGSFPLGYSELGCPFVAHSGLSSTLAQLTEQGWAALAPRDTGSGLQLAPRKLLERGAKVQE